MSRKCVFEKITITKVICPFEHTTFVLSTSALTTSITDKITISCNDVNKTKPLVQLLAINILRYFVIKEVNDSLGIK